MQLVTLNEIIEEHNLSNTEFYTKLNELKQNNQEIYNEYIRCTTDGSLAIEVDKKRNFLDLLLANEAVVVKDHLKLTIDSLKEELKRSELRYNKLFEEYLQLVKELQEANFKLIEITESQQSLISEQYQAVRTSDPRNLAKKLRQFDEELVEEQVNKQREFDDLYQNLKRKRR